MLAKRLLDVLAAIIGLLVLLPVLVLISFWIKFDSRGPVLYRQARVGRFGRLFLINKFRTMVVDADKIGPAVTTRADRRITRSGAFLRRTKLDELPQLWNVLVGDMSLVGPRPEVPVYVEKYAPEDRQVVLSVRPGITDEASIEFRNESELLSVAEDPDRVYVESIMPRKLAVYRNYVEFRTFVGDLRILYKTLIRVVWD